MKSGMFDIEFLIAITPIHVYKKTEKKKRKTNNMSRISITSEIKELYELI